jgi:uncharacterized protein YecE (DUF72 family)
LEYSTRAKTQKGSGAEMDSIFYEKFYSHMTKGTFIGMAKATPDNFQFSLKVPEAITHRKRLDVNNGASTSFDEFLARTSPLRSSNKLGVILLQLPTSLTVNDFQNVEGFLQRLPLGYQYAAEFRHPSWKTEGPWDLLKHYNIAAVMTDSPSIENLEFLSDVIVTTADHSFIRFHGRIQKDIIGIATRTVRKN